MCSKMFAYFAVVLLHVDIVTPYRSIVLDTTEDLFRSWKVEGNYLYLPSGDHLEDILGKKLPADFNFKPFQSTVGIWTVVPDDAFRHSSSGQNNATSLLTTASFSFQLSAQLFSSVSVKYNIRGKGAKIYIQTTEHGKPLYEIEAVTEAPSFDWVEINVPLDISSKFFIKAEVNETGDYILIDRIEGIYLDTTTSTKRPKTTTSPTPLPVSSANHISSSFLLFAFIPVICTALTKVGSST